MPPKYRPGAQDADGRYYLTVGAGNVLGAKIYDATVDDWHTIPVTFSGFGRDGFSYYQGERIVVADFADGLQKAWGTWQSAMQGYSRGWFDYYLWQRNNAHVVPVSIVSGAVRLETTFLGSFEIGSAIGSAFRWSLEGDFDIQCDCKNLSGSNYGSDYFLKVFAGNTGFSGADQYIAAGVQITGPTSMNWGWRHDPYFLNIHSGARSNGKLRLTRSGSVYSAYVDWGSGWTLCGALTPSGKKLNRPRVNVALVNAVTQFSTPNEPTSCDFSNFTINSGTVVYRPGWALEAAGTHRGSRDDFPEKALLIWTAKEIAIIDLVEDKLWWRAQKGSNQFYLLNDFSHGTVQIQDAHMRNGVLYISMRDTNTAAGGGTIVVDFVADGAVVYSNTVGACYRKGSMFTDPDSGAGRGQWQEPEPLNYRHGGGLTGWANNHDWDTNYATANQHHYANATYRAGGYVYRAIAHYAGLQVFRFQEGRGYESTPSNAHATWSGSTTCQAAGFASDGRLIFATASNLYSVPFATWQGAIGSTFNPTAIASPGTVSVISQYRFALSPTHIWVARNEGLYSCPFAGLSFSAASVINAALPAFDRCDSVDHPSASLVIVSTKSGSSFHLHSVNESGTLFESQDITSYVTTEPIRSEAGA
jgi:hypothetical protein